MFSVREGRYIRHMKISIARKKKQTKEEQRDLLIHEMIHEYVYLKSGKVAHNRMFKNKMKELNEKYGLDIRKNSKHLFRKYGNTKTLFQKLISLFE